VLSLCHYYCYHWYYHCYHHYLLAQLDRTSNKEGRGGGYLTSPHLAVDRQKKIRVKSKAEEKW